jgi:hypothetical protein
MENANELKMELMPSDAQAITMVAEFTAGYVRKVLNGRRSHEVIKSVANKLEDRERLKESLPDKNNDAQFGSRDQDTCFCGSPEPR